MCHLFPGFSGLLTGIGIFLGLMLFISSLTPAGAFTFEPQNRPGAFEARLATYMRAGEFIVGIATGSIVLLVGASGLHSTGHLPWRYASPLVLLTFTVIYGVLFMALLAYNYEMFLHGNAYTRFRYVRNQSLGFSALACFCAGYAWLVVSIIVEMTRP
jgi:hypothetical protein